jgi:aryl-phospho-beta-D-glucosidase BglC (GH1 family)
MKLQVLSLLISLLAGSAAADSVPHVGVNLGGWFLIEEWMFSFGQFDRVAEMSDLPQGVVMPPLLPDGMGENWYGEGDLVNKIVAKYDEDFAVQVIEAHRQTYITDEDIAAMKSANITNVRMPLGWWAFVEESLKDASEVITDPAHSDMKFVTITQEALRTEIQRFKVSPQRGISVGVVLLARYSISNLIFTLASVVAG